MPDGALPRPVDAVLFDAGGVLVDLDYGYLARLIEPRHRRVAERDLSRSEAMARAEIQRRVLAGDRTSSVWRDYFHFILGSVHVPAAEHEAIIDSLWEAHQRVGLWTVAIPGSADAVRELKQRGLRLGVVSNAEGRVARDLANAGYDGLFEEIVDSHVVGVEKPDPAIFEIAIERLGIDRAHTLFVGDLPAVDVAGARSAGLTPLLVDPHDLYRDIPVTRLGSLSDLPALLA